MLPSVVLPNESKLASCCSKPKCAHFFCQKPRGIDYVITGTLLVGVAALLVFRPMRGVAGSIESGWTSVQCSMNFDNVSLTGAFYTFETGQHIMLLEDQNTAEHNDLPSECAAVDAHCTIARIANANNNAQAADGVPLLAFAEHLMR